MSSNKREYFVIVFSIILSLIIVISEFSYSYWSHKTEIIMTYQQTYEKNQDCRSALAGHGKRYVDEICGKIPMYEDYFKR